MKDFETVLKSFIGGRDEQQDSADCFFDGDTAFAVVCDGMGGYSGGSAASALAVKEMCERFHANGKENIPEFFLKNIEAVNSAVHNLKTADGKPLKCGTTLVCAAVKNKQLFWLSVGDSRLYIFRKKTLTQVTQDHNYFLILNEKLKNGEINQDEYDLESSKGHSLISCIGTRKLGRVHMNVQPFALKKGDMLLLATDGLYKALSEEDICDSFYFTATVTAEDIEEKISKLDVSLLDNITYVIIKIL